TEVWMTEQNTPAANEPGDEQQHDRGGQPRPGKGGKQRPQPGKGGQPEEEDENALRQRRLEKLEKLRAEGVHVYPERFDRTHTLAEAQQRPEGTRVRVAGRLVLMRDMGKLTFATLQDLDGRLQLSLTRDGLHADPEESKRLYQR